jgi:hypothetical protein
MEMLREVSLGVCETREREVAPSFVGTTLHHNPGRGWGTMYDFELLCRQLLPSDLPLPRGQALCGAVALRQPSAPHHPRVQRVTGRSLRAATCILVLEVSSINTITVAGPP